jgi:biopolymer transport protein ExbD
VKVRRSVHLLRGPLDMTALIDVVLLLLIFFILSSSFVLQPGIKVNPPRGISQSGISNTRSILSITAQNPPMLFLNDQVIALDRLEGEFRRMARANSNASIVVRADAEVPHGLVTEVMGRALEAGVAVVIATKPAAASTP